VELLLNILVNHLNNSSICNNIGLMELCQINLIFILNTLKDLQWVTIHNIEWFIDLSQRMEHHSSALLPYLKEI